MRSEEENIQFSPSTREIPAMLPAPKALAGRAKRKRRASATISTFGFMVAMTPDFPVYSCHRMADILKDKDGVRCEEQEREK
jgi:hypothetical protein